MADWLENLTTGIDRGISHFRRRPRQQGYAPSADMQADQMRRGDLDKINQEYGKELDDIQILTASGQTDEALNRTRRLQFDMARKGYSQDAMMSIFNPALGEHIRKQPTDTGAYSTGMREAVGFDPSVKNMGTAMDATSQAGARAAQAASDTETAETTRQRRPGLVGKDKAQAAAAGRSNPGPEAKPAMSLTSIFGNKTRIYQQLPLASDTEKPALMAELDELDRLETIERKRTGLPQRQPVKPVVPPPAAPESGGVISGMVDAAKGLFGGGGAAPPSATPQQEPMAAPQPQQQPLAAPQAAPAGGPRIKVSLQRIRALQQSGLSYEQALQRAKQEAQQQPR
jgi:hypothetical protein